MSAVEARRAAHVDRRVASIVALGVAALLLRIRIVQAPDVTRIWLLAALYGAILTGSLLVRMPHDRPRVARPVALAVGLLGVALAAVAAGAPVPAPLGMPALFLGVLAAVAEEALFRRALYGWLERYGAAVAIAGSALLFALIHVPLYGTAALPVDLGAGLLLSWQRWASGSWSVPAATHVAANLLAVILR